MQNLRSLSAGSSVTSKKVVCGKRVLNLLATQLVLLHRTAFPIFVGRLNILVMNHGEFAHVYLQTQYNVLTTR
jgi:hypothetical protein